MIWKGSAQRPQKGATLPGQGSQRNQGGASQPDLKECHILQNANFPSTFVLTEGKELGFHISMSVVIRAGTMGRYISSQVPSLA